VAVTASFYVLPDQAEEDKVWRFACRLVEKIIASGIRVGLLTASEAQSLRLDSLLWTFRDLAFVPHTVWPEKDDHAKVIIGRPPVCAEWGECLVNLTDELPAPLDDATMIVELVWGEPEKRHLARERYRHYRSMGWTMVDHRITSWR